MKSFGQFSESNEPDVPEFYKRVKTRHQYPVDKDAYTEIGHQAYTGGIGSNTNTELWVHHDDNIKRKKIPEWRPKATHGDMFGMDELHYPEGGPRRPSGRVDHDLKAISLTYDNKTPPSHISGIVQKLRKAHPDYVIKDYERNEIVNESLKKDIAKVLGTAAVAGAVAFGGGKAVKNMFPKKPEVHIAQVNAAAPQIKKPKASLIIPKDVQSKMPEVKTKEPPGHKEFHARLQQHFGEEYPIIMAAAERNGIKPTDHDHIATLFGIRKAENGKSGKEFGVLAPKALGKKGEGKETTLDRQAGWAAATVMSKYRSHISSGGKPEDFIPYLASKYAPAGASNDPTGLNKNWTKNVSGWRDVFHGKKDKITEAKKHLHVFDFDDTLAHTNSKVKVTDTRNGEITYLTPAEYAKFTPEKHHQMDYTDFHNVVDPVPVTGLDRAARNASRKGRDVAVLTARPAKSEDAIRKYLKTRGVRGKRLKIMAVGSSDPNAKRDALDTHIAGKNYKKVEFSDDHAPNVDAVGELQQSHPNTKFRLRHVKIKEETKPKILTRLTNQLRSKGVSGAANVAIGKLRQFGILQQDSLALTDKGETRNSMTPGERAKDRASKKSGNSPSKYTYNKQTNTAKLKD
jgi:hypothetical protein